MKLRHKITGGLLCVFLLSVFMGAYSLFAVLRINNMKSELNLITELNDQVKGHVIAHHNWRYNIFFAFTYGEEFAGGLDPDTCGYGLWYHGSYARQFEDVRVSELLRAIDQPHRDMHVQGAAALQLRAEGRIEEAQQLLQDVVLPAGADAIVYLTALSYRFDELRMVQSDAIDVVVQRTIIFNIIISAASLLVFVVIYCSVTFKRL